MGEEWKTFCPQCNVWKIVRLGKQQCPDCGGKTEHMIRNYKNSELKVG